MQQPSHTNVKSAFARRCRRRFLYLTTQSNPIRTNHNNRSGRLARPPQPPPPARARPGQASPATTMMRRGGRRSRPRPPDGLAGSIPDEILQEEILTRLPAKSVLRCRAVCRLWRRLTTDPAFLVAHHGRQPTLPLVASPGCLVAFHVEMAELRQVHLLEWWWCYRTVGASCDGLVITGDDIYNPATRQVAPLGLTGDYKLVGLYRHQPSGEYRVLFWTLIPSEDVPFPSEVYCPNAYCVFTVGSKKPPRRIPSSLAHVDGEAELISGQGPRVLGAPVHLHGNLHVHWKKQLDGHYHRILVFDTVAESLRQMRPPAVNPRHMMQLFDMGGKLAASCSKDDCMVMRIFALQVYESQVWSFQYRIKLPEVEIRRRFQEQGDWLARVVSGEGDLLVSCFGWLLHCDRNGKLLAKFQYDDDFPALIPHRLKESLIQHTFFQKEEQKNCTSVPDGLQETSSPSAGPVGRRPRKPNPRVFGDEWVN